jgi:hypothetical protein
LPAGFFLAAPSAYIRHYGAAQFIAGRKRTDDDTGRRDKLPTIGDSEMAPAMADRNDEETNDPPRVTT